MKFLNLPWERCWCFRTVRAGSIASAIYALVCAVLRIIGTVVEEVVIAHERASLLDSNSTSSEVVLDVESSLWYVELVIALLLLAAGTCLLIGILRHKAFLLIPFIVLFGLIVALEVLLTFLAVMVLLFWLTFGSLAMLGFILIFLFVDASCLLCVVSHYMNLRAGREPMRAIYRSQGERLGDFEEGAAALPQKSGMSRDPNMQFAPGAVPFSSNDGEAPPPYREV